MSVSVPVFSAMGSGATLGPKQQTGYADGMSSTPIEPWWVYIVECADGTLYTGCTNNVVRRLVRHNQGQGAKYTQGRGPVQLRYLEECADHGTALRREYEVKHLSHRDKTELCTQPAVITQVEAWQQAARVIPPTEEISSPQ